MPNRFFLVVVLVAALLPWPGMARGNDSASPWPADRTVLIVSADHAYPPYEYLDNGRPPGFNVDLKQTVAEAMGLAVEVRLGPWQEVKDDLETGRADALAGMNYSEERARTFGFPVPTMVSSCLFVRGYTVLTVFSGEEALAVYADQGQDIGMVVMDLGMPGMGGRQCLRELLAVDPGVQVLIASGYADNKLAEELQRAGARGVLGKPYQLKELAAKVREVLGG